MAEVILALDLPNRDAALALLDRLPALRWVKVGSVLMTREGTPLIAELRRRGLEVFLDLKWHDIPNTVAGAVAAARELGVRMATVHALGGEEMMRAAATAAGPAMGVVGVTVLTSHNARSFAHATGRATVDITAEGPGSPVRRSRPGCGGGVLAARTRRHSHRRRGNRGWWYRGSGVPPTPKAISAAPPGPNRRWRPAPPIWWWAGRS